MRTCSGVSAGPAPNLGVVTAFEFEVDEVGDVGFGQFVVDATDTAALLQSWGAAVEAAPRDTTSFLYMGRPRLGSRPMAQIMCVVDSSDPETVVNRLRPLADVAPLLDQAAQILPYADLLHVPKSHHNGQGDPVARSGLLAHISAEFAAAAAKLLESGAVYFFSIRSVGGAVADVDPAATAYANRSANFSVTAFGADRELINEHWADLYGHFSGLYTNFETDLRPERLNDAYPAETLRRLRELKARFDPDNVFRDNFNISPAVLTVV